MSSETLHANFGSPREQGSRVATSIIASLVFLGVIAAIGGVVIDAMPNVGKKTLTAGIMGFIGLVGALGISGSLHGSRS